jgi:diguanylate cyclase (GGDEF)-like protein
MSGSTSGTVIELRRAANASKPLRTKAAVSMVWVLAAAFSGHIVVNRLIPDSLAARFELDHVFCNIAYLVAAVATGWRSRVSRRERWPWRLLTAALLSYLVGNVLSVYAPGSSYPSPADLFWLAFYGLSFVAIVMLTMIRLRTSVSAWLDGAIAGVGAGAVASAFCFRHVMASTSASWAATATNIAYPTADLTLVVLLVAIGYAVRGKDQAWWLLALGFVIVFVGDLVFLYQSAAGTWNPTGEFESFWPAAATVIGIAACSSRSVRVRRPSSMRFVIPTVFALMAVVVLVVGQVRSLPPVAVVLAVITLVIASLRAATTIREVQRVAAARSEERIDYLTGLSNRRVLVEYLDECVRDASRRVAVLVLDLDRFKEVNDSLGHVAGDRLLRRVAARLAGAVPATSLLARLGGDEFGLVLRDHDEAAAREVGRELLAALAAPFSLKGLHVNVGASVGVAISPDHGRTGSALLANADIAMYWAKRHRVGVASFQPDSENPSRDRLQHINRLRAALVSDQFLLYFQPQLQASTGGIVGVEALVRWQHPVDGLVGPDRFLPMLAQLGLMDDLTDLVLRQAVTSWADLCGRGHDLRMSINVAASDLAGFRFADSFEQLALEFGIPAGAFVVEVTEDDVIADLESSQQTLRALRRSGALISIDDYGTGQASLSYLRDLPLDELKLDRSFLRGTPGDHHNSVIVRSTIELAHTLRLPIVAEGVETEATLQWLASLGCDVCQGYHIARPLPLDELARWLESAAAANSVVSVRVIDR